MDRAELEASWGRTRSHLGRAIAAFEARGGSPHALAAAVDYLEHNELELSADALADAADELDSPEFWAALAAAAYEMKLVDRALGWTVKTGRYPCPCCGHLVFSEPPGSYSICRVCFWEDDPVQLRWPGYGGGANRPSLIEAQAEYRAVGAMERRFIGNVRDAADDEPIEPGWRPADPALDDLEQWGPSNDPWPADYTTLYWWRPTYRRRAVDPASPA